MGSTGPAHMARSNRQQLSTTSLGSDCETAIPYIEDRCAARSRNPGFVPYRLPRSRSGCHLTESDSAVASSFYA